MCRLRKQARSSTTASHLSVSVSFVFMPKEKSEAPKPKLRATVLTDEYLAEIVTSGRDSSFVVKDLKSGEITMSDSLEDGRIIPFYPAHGFLQVTKLSSAIEDFGTDAELITDIRSFIRKWVDLSEIYEKLCTYYVLLSWCYDEFREIPYLRVLADLGSGKSRLGIDVLGSICYKSIPTMAVSSMSAIFRTLDAMGGTLILDEADLGDESEKTSEIVQLLNSGYKKGVPVLRCSLGVGGVQSEAFRVFGPKVILSREHMKDHALESRCLPVRLTRTERKDLPLFTDQSLEDESEHLRNKLLKWRLDGYGTRMAQRDMSFIELPIPPRFKQLFIILSAVISDKATKEELKKYALEIAEEASSMRSDSFEGDLLEAIHEVLTQSPSLVAENVEVSFNDILEKINLTRPEHQKIKLRGVSKGIREKLSLDTGRIGHDNKNGLKCTLLKLNTSFRNFGLTEIDLTKSYPVESLDF